MRFYIGWLSIIFISSTSIANPWANDSGLPGNKICKTIKGHEVCFSDSNRKNVFNLSENELSTAIENGSQHALHYPVTVSELQIPYQTLLNFFNSEANTPIRKFIFKIAQGITNYKSMDDIYNYLGLNQFPHSRQKENPNLIYNPYRKDNSRMGVTINGHGNSRRMTIGCAACHSANLFGVKVMGLTNRFPRANEFFIKGQKALKIANPALYKAATGASKEEMEIFKNSKNAIKYVGLKKPQALGLDTSLAQVGLSLAKRSQDEYASRNPIHAMFPRKNKLKNIPADSKPAVWWNVKYKTKFLSDGSVRSGNPVHTNFLWNELGRGTDLKKLESWMQKNDDQIRDLTTYVFNAVAPKYNDFFPNKINITQAKKGQKLFVKNCSGCHGIYEKGWDLENANELPYQEKIATTKTWYHTQTKVIDVGTDEYRYKGMSYFAKELNQLKISKTVGTIVEPQKGYVPPPLEGIWARWPYFHNNSAPSLYDVITPQNKRPKQYYAREALSKTKDFDEVKNGYPQIIGDKKYLFNTKIKGLSNKGHTKMLLTKEGREKFNHQDKLNIIEFLQSL